jgi:hypothetical protein
MKPFRPYLYADLVFVLLSLLFIGGLSWLLQWQQGSYDRGYADGYTAGRRDGYRTGFDDAATVRAAEKHMEKP